MRRDCHASASNVVQKALRGLEERQRLRETHIQEYRTKIQEAIKNPAQPAPLREAFGTGTRLIPLSDIFYTVQTDTLRLARFIAD